SPLPDRPGAHLPGRPRRGGGAGGAGRLRSARAFWRRPRHCRGCALPPPPAPAAPAPRTIVGRSWVRHGIARAPATGRLPRPAAGGVARPQQAVADAGSTARPAAAGNADRGAEVARRGPQTPAGRRAGERAGWGDTDATGAVGERPGAGEEATGST